jgi:hypothetical protein
MDYSEYISLSFGWYVMCISEICLILEAFAFRSCEAGNEDT